MTLPTIDPAAFDLPHCACPHCDCDCSNCGAANAAWFVVGDTLLTDRVILMPPETLAPRPEIANTVALPDAMAKLLASTYSDQPSEECFHPRYLDPLEAAGYHIRPQVNPLRIPGQDALTRCHAITYEDAVVGLLMPLTDPVEISRRAA